MVPHVYDVPKIHKAEYPLHVIVSSIGNPLNNLASILHKIIQNNLPPADFNNDNNFQLKLKIFLISKILENAFISRYSVTFINTLIDLVLESLSKYLLSLLSGILTLQRRNFLKAVNLVLNSIYFVLIISFINRHMKYLWVRYYSL